MHFPTSCHLENMACPFLFARRSYHRLEWKVIGKNWFSLSTPIDTPNILRFCAIIVRHLLVPCRLRHSFCIHPFGMSWGSLLARARKKPWNIVDACDDSTELQTFHLLKTPWQCHMHPNVSPFYNWMLWANQHPRTRSLFIKELKRELFWWVCESVCYQKIGFT